MQIVSVKKEDLCDLVTKNECQITYVYLKVSDIDEEAKELIASISDTSWIKGLNCLSEKAYTARVNKTVDKLVNQVFNKVSETEGCTKDFGEYLVSCSSQEALVEGLGHVKYPLADLIKERLSNNGGFDFHTESPAELFVFGEAKFSAGDPPWGKALGQINRFIKENMDYSEYIDLRDFASDNAKTNLEHDKRSFAAAFSLGNTDADSVYNSMVKSKHFYPLLSHPELFLLAVEICEPKENTSR